MSPKLPTPVAMLWSENRYDDAQMLAMYHHGRREAFSEAMAVLIGFLGYSEDGLREALDILSALAEKEPK